MYYVCSSGKLEGKNDDTIYMICNTEDGSLHYYNRDACSTLNYRVQGVDTKNKTIEVVPSFEIFRLFLIKRKVSTGKIDGEVLFHTNQLKISGNIGGFTSYLSYEVRNKVELCSSELEIPVLDSFYFAWDWLDMSLHSYNTVVFNKPKRLAANKPKRIKKIIFRLPEGSVVATHALFNNTNPLDGYDYSDWRGCEVVIEGCKEVIVDSGSTGMFKDSSYPRGYSLSCIGRDSKIIIAKDAVVDPSVCMTSASLVNNSDYYETKELNWRPLSD